MHGDAAFTAFMTEAEPRLRRALVARFGMHVGRDATLDAFVYGWKNWERIGSMENPVGYLYRVGVSQARPPRSVAIDNQMLFSPRRRGIERMGDAIMTVAENKTIELALLQLSAPIQI